VKTLEQLGWHKATWTNGKSKKTGYWIYNWQANKFTILLDSYDSVTGRQRSLNVCGDVPEWGKWTRVK
jgi:hypothetical protein